ncbi:Heterokaryon incompatibility protein 6,OR allele [Lachnellula hyalina]|uniref:Heterokaryon incompatibility protein 6,OR allele n=1 Tax=Lachnellula hyalina TaxID=1316788 RepID=A0A8H8QX81_9HELO|nr:Heterokaryon incompatibility protein 6,OR allele [Lachnellula hyalina]TVY23751.1 Heterokaryon incompatibility protein 6,OR allele [Lachnellula hyalina]
MYSTLPRSLSGKSNTIRLLKLRAALEHTMIECDLEVVDLETRPRLEALSYVWGNPNPPEAILCNGHQHSVTPNLALALRRIRSPCTTRTVWVDAICVNQEDLEERSQQIQLMREIYSQAWRVIVWLGEDNGLAETAIQTIKWFAAECCAKIGKSLDAIDLDMNSPMDLQLRSYTSTTARLQRPTPIQTPNEWQAIEWFYDQPWFSRAWVVQEVAFAPPVFYIGPFEIGWKEVAVTATWIGWNVTHPYNTKLVDVYERAEEIFKQRGNYRPYLESLIAGGLIMYSKATDPRDKIYAFLGLMHESDRKGVLLQPDYSKSVVHVYGDAVRHMIQQNEDDAKYNLTEAFASIESSNTGTEGFPSWIPRWDNPSMLKNPWYRLRTGFLDRGWSASRDKVPEVRNVSDREILVLKGLKVANISRVFPLQRKSDDADWLTHIWKEISVLLDASPWAETKELVLLKAIGSLYSDFNANIESVPVEGYKFLLEMVLVSCFVSCGGERDEEGHYISESNIQEDLDAYDTDPTLSGMIIEANLSDCGDLARFINECPFSLFITEDNNLGAGTRDARAGDLVSILYGGEPPFLLRQAGAQWKFMEACYMNGAMYGEAIEELKRGKLGEEWFEIR